VSNSILLGTPTLKAQNDSYAKNFGDGPLGPMDEWYMTAEALV